VHHAEPSEVRHRLLGLQDDDLRVHDEGAHLGAPGGRRVGIPRSREG
jgi:hypothetical protein